MRVKETKTSGRRMLWQSGVLVVFAIITGLLINQVRTGGLALVATDDPDVSNEEGAEGSLRLTLEEARRLFIEKEAVFLDARSPKYYEKGHLAGARSLPLETVETTAFEVLADVPQDAVLITYCDGKNCILAKRLAATLREMGFQNIRVLANGWTRWVKMGLPTEKGPAGNAS